MAYPRVKGVVTVQGRDISALCNDLADRETMPPRVLVACGIAESNLNEQAERYGTWPDVSFGLWQQTVAYAPIGDGTNSASNIVDVRGKLFDVAIAAPIAAQQLGRFWRQYRDGPETLGRYNWPARGLQGNPNRANIERGWRESARYVQEGPMPGRTYDPDTPAELQVQPWACSIRTTTWMLKSIGLDVRAEDLEGEMVGAGLVNAASGLLDGSGTALAAWLRERFGVDAMALWISWPWLQNLAGQGPMGIGGVAWNHWAGVRRPVDAWSVALANPAPGWQGVQHTLTLDDYRRLGPFAAVRIAVEVAEPAPQPAPEPPTETNEQRLVNLVGYLAGDVADALQVALDSIGAARTAAQRQKGLEAAQAALNTLKAAR